MKRLMFIALGLAGGAVAAQTGGPSEELGPSLAQVRSFATSSGNNIWRGYGAAPFGFLLVGTDSEVLMCQASPKPEFSSQGVDPATRCPRWTRPKSGLSGTFLAAMPLFGPPPTIVMGTPQSTGRTRGEWLRTVLHEHFHQYQSTFSNYYGRVDALDLHGSDTTGMWMLQYPFPYREAAVVKAQAAASIALREAVAERGQADFRAAFDRYLSARATFQTSVSPKDWRYIEFELWAEGVARWTEIFLGRHYPDKQVKVAAQAMEKGTLAQLASPDLPGQGREFVYAYGAGEAMLMEACGSRWRKEYPRTLSMLPLLTSSRAHCLARPGGSS